jgi:class 3 adenylate cyclase
MTNPVYSRASHDVLVLRHASNIWSAGERVRVRMGVHCGEATQTAAGLADLEVHRAARMAATAHGGQVLLSESAAVLVRDWLPPGAVLTDLGVHRLAADLGSPFGVAVHGAPPCAATRPDSGS